MGKVQFSLLLIANKVTSLFHIRRDAPPMFNRPLDTACPHHRMARMVYSIFLTLLVLIAIPVITLGAMTFSFIEDNRQLGFKFETTERDGEAVVEVVLAALPRMLYQAPAKLALVAAVISVFLGATHLGFVATDWKNGKRTQTYAFRRNIMFLHLTNGILVLFALVSIFVTHKLSSHFRASRVNDKNPNSDENFVRYNIGTFDLETWACELKDVRGAAMVKDDYGRQCGVEVAGRAMMIPLLIVAWVVAFVGVWGLVGGGRRGPDGERIKTEDVGLEMDKMNAI